MGGVQITSNRAFVYRQPKEIVRQTHTQKKKKEIITNETKINRAQEKYCQLELM